MPPAWKDSRLHHHQLRNQQMRRDLWRTRMSPKKRHRKRSSLSSKKAVNYLQRVYYTNKRPSLLQSAEKVIAAVKGKTNSKAHTGTDPAVVEWSGNIHRPPKTNTKVQLKQGYSRSYTGPVWSRLDRPGQAVVVQWQYVLVLIDVFSKYMDGSHAHLIEW